MSDPPKLNLVPVTDPSQPPAPQPAAPSPPAGTTHEPTPKKRTPRAKKPADRRPAAQSTAPAAVVSPTGAASAAAATSAAEPAGTAAGGSWREWGSFDRTVSYRLPPELLDELDERIWKLRLPIGVTIAAAIADLLDKPNPELLKLVERAEESKPRRRPRSS
jgi:hypothetical protein